MYPDQNQNQDQQPYSIDYLNEIAPQQQKSPMNNKMFFFVIGGGLLLALIIGFFVLFNGGGGKTKNMEVLAARLQTLETVATESQKNIKSGELRNTNSNLTIFLTNTNRDITEQLATSGINTEKLSESVKSAEDGAKLKETLEDARLNAVFDRTYAREMSYQLETVSGLLVELYNNTNRQSFKDFLETTDKNLNPLIEQFSEFNAANG